MIAVLWPLSWSFKPEGEWRPGATTIVTVTLLLALHALLYFGGASFRTRIGVRWYFAAQAAVVFAIGLAPGELLLMLALTAALTATANRQLRGLYSTTTITLAAIVVFGAATTVSSGVYRGATVALVLGAVSMVVRALTPAGDKAAPGPVAVEHPSAVRGNAAQSEALTTRETEVLRLAASGSRSKEIAVRLGITERTVKAHLAAAYRKLGVDSRAAAAAKASQLGLL